MIVKFHFHLPSLIEIIKFTLSLNCKTVRIFGYSSISSSQTKGMERG